MSELVHQIETELQQTTTLESLEDVRVKYLGRQGLVTTLLRAVGEQPAAERAKAGARANEIRQSIEALIEAQRTKLVQAELADVAAHPIDLTAPGRTRPLGHRHPVSRTIQELVEIFWQMGYQVAEGPEVETTWHNFEALNIGPDHPARDMQDTFYLEGEHLPRTHTSGIQIRYMQDHQPPIRIIAPGKVYRNEDEDASHSWIFYQIEGLVVDKGISLGDLKGTLLAMMRGILGDDTQVRLRPNYFPYTEPSVEMDATCAACHGSGRVSTGDCSLCTGLGWLELGGAGMVHPNVLRNAGIDPTVYSGFAFGFGPERIATIKYGVDDVRGFWRPDLRFLEQFS